MKDIYIDGINDIKELKIEKGASMHDILNLCFRITREEKNSFKKYLGKSIDVKCSKDDVSCIFCGKVTSISINNQNNSWLCYLIAHSETNAMDKDTKSIVYQDENQSLKTIVKNIYDEYGYTVFFSDAGISNEPYHSLILQNDETDWQFIKRLCFEKGLDVFCNVEDGVWSWIGKPDREIREIDDKEVVAFYSDDKHTNFSFISKDVLDIGDNVLYEGTEYVVSESVFEVINGRLHKTYRCDDNVLFEGSSDSITKIFFAEVLEVEKGNVGRIKVKFPNERWTTDDPIWLPWITSYSNGECGFYFMPEIGESVKVVIPDYYGKGVYADGNIRKQEIDNNIEPQDKVIQIGNKAIRFSNEVIRIENDKCEICITTKGIVIKNEKCEINLTDFFEVNVGNSKFRIEKSDTSLKTNKFNVE